MSQTESRPAAGVRYALSRVDGEGGGEGQALYRGFAHLPGADVPIEVRVQAPAGEGGAGAAEARVDEAALPEGAPEAAELAREAAALLKAAVRPALSAGRAPPRKVVRWRP